MGQETLFGSPESGDGFGSRAVISRWSPQIRIIEGLLFPIPEEYRAAKRHDRLKLKGGRRSPDHAAAAVPRLENVGAGCDRACRQLGMSRNR
jgi:hypothetical protein